MAIMSSVEYATTDKPADPAVLSIDLSPTYALTVSVCIRVVFEAPTPTELAAPIEPAIILVSKMPSAVIVILPPAAIFTAVPLGVPSIYAYVSVSITWTDTEAAIPAELATPALAAIDRISSLELASITTLPSEFTCAPLPM